MSYVRCVRGLASGIEYPADKPMNLDPADGRPVEMVLDLERLAQVAGDPDARDGHHSDPRILQGADTLGDHLANRLVHPTHTLRHGG